MRKHDEQITVRIPSAMLQEIMKAAHALRVRKSCIIKRSIKSYLDFQSQENLPSRENKFQPK